MEIKQLKGGTIIAPQPLAQSKSGMRMGTPGTLFMDSITGEKLTECAQKQFGIPIVTHIRVVFREVEGVIYLVVAPVRLEGSADGSAKPKRGSRRTKGAMAADLVSEIYELKHTPQQPTVYHLTRLVAALGQPLRTDFWYAMDSEIVQDETLGLSVAGDWTHARLEPRERRPAKKGSGSTKGPDEKNKGNMGNTGSNTGAQSSDTVAKGTGTTEAGGSKAS